MRHILDCIKSVTQAWLHGRYTNTVLSFPANDGYFNQPDDAA